MPSVTSNRPCRAHNWDCRHKLGLATSGQLPARKEKASLSQTTRPLASLTTHGSSEPMSPRSASSKSARSSNGSSVIQAILTRGNPAITAAGGTAAGHTVGRRLAPGLQQRSRYELPNRSAGPERDASPAVGEDWPSLNADVPFAPAMNGGRPGDKGPLGSR